MARAAVDHRSFEIQLAAMSSAEISRMRDRLDAASEAGLAAFDQYARNKVTSRPELKRYLRKSADSCSITYIASLRWPKIEEIQVTPSLSQDTTGRNRQPITVTGWVGKPVLIPYGFIWQHRLWRRIPYDYEAMFKKENRGKYKVYGYFNGQWKEPIVYVSGRYLWELDGLPRPADVLTRCVDEVIAATEGVLNGGRTAVA